MMFRLATSDLLPFVLVSKWESSQVNTWVASPIPTVMSIENQWIKSSIRMETFDIGRPASAVG
jgi:hypothetical protein